MRRWLVVTAISLSLALCGGLVADEFWLPDMNPGGRTTDTKAGWNSTRTIYAERIVLHGPECIITLDATTRSPGIQVYSRRTRELSCVSIGQDGRAVVGIAIPLRRDLVAALYADKGQGAFQLADLHGKHAINGEELSRRWGR